MKSLPISEQCTEIDAEILKMLYECKRKKYHKTLLPQKQINNKIISCNIIKNSTPQSTDLKLGTSTPASISITKDEEMSAEYIESNIALARLQDSLDLAIAEAERLYYNCDYQQCHVLTELILKQDPYHFDCLPIHISCEVELKLSNSMFFSLC